MTSLYDYQNAINQYSSERGAYLSQIGNVEQLGSIKDELSEQKGRDAALAGGMPLGLTTASIFAKTKGGKMFLSRLGRKLGMSQEEAEQTASDLADESPGKGFANILDRISGKVTQKLTKGKGKAEEPEEAEEEEPFEDVDVDVKPTLTMTRTIGEKAGQQQIMEAEVTPRDQFYDAQEEPEDLEGDLIDQEGGAVYREDVSFPQQEGTAMGRMVGKTGAEAAEGEAVTAGEAGEAASAGEVLATTAGEATGELATGEAVGGFLDATPLAPLGILIGIGAALGSLFGGLFGHHHHHHTIPKPPNFSIPSLQTGV